MQCLQYSDGIDVIDHCMLNVKDESIKSILIYRYDRQRHFYTAFCGFLNQVICSKLFIFFRLFRLNVQIVRMLTDIKRTLMDIRERHMMKKTVYNVKTVAKNMQIKLTWTNIDYRVVGRKHFTAAFVKLHMDTSIVMTDKCLKNIIFNNTAHSL